MTKTNGEPKNSTGIQQTNNPYLVTLNDELKSNQKHVYRRHIFRPDSATSAASTLAAPTTTTTTTTVATTDQIRQFYKRLKSSLRFNACISAAKPSSSVHLRHPPSNHWSNKQNERSSFYSYTPTSNHPENAPQIPSDNGQFPAYVVANPDHDTDRESITSNSSEISTGTLQNIRDQMATSLKKMRALEEQVKQVPLLKQQVKQLSDEKKILAEQIRTKPNPPNPIPPPQRVSPVSLDHLNVPLLPKDNGFSEVFLNRRATNQSRKGQAPPPPSPRGSSVSSSTAYDESVTSESPTSPTKRSARPRVTRDIGVVTNQTIFQSRGTNCELRLYTKQELEAAIDLTIAKQTQVRQKRSATVSTQFSPPLPPPVATRSTYVQTPLAPSSASVATMTYPTVRVDASTNCRPATRTTGSSDHTILEAPCPKCSVRKRTTSSGPDLQIDQIQYEKPNTKDFMTASLPSTLISLKSLDIPMKTVTFPIDDHDHPQSPKTKSVSTQVTPRPCKTTTIGTQSMTGSGIHVACQHVPDKTQHKLTDTKGLIRYHHQSIGPEQSIEFIDHATNTSIPPRTVHNSTNTAPIPSTVNSSTSPESIQIRDVSSSATEDAIKSIANGKQTHIQINCSSGCPTDVGYCDRCKEAIRSIAREVAFTSSTSLQKSGSSGSVAGASPVSEFSRIPRPTTLLSPRPERRFVRQTTYTIHSPMSLPNNSTTTPNSGVASDDDEEKATCPAEVFLRRLSQSSGADFSRGYPHRQQSPVAARRHHSVPPNNAAAINKDKQRSPPRLAVNALEEEPHNEPIESRLMLSGNPSEEQCQSNIKNTNREKISPSHEVKAALKVINDAIYQKQLNKKSQNSDVEFATATHTANRVVQAEWFQISSTDHSNPLDVEDYLDAFEEYSNALLRYMVNMADTNGNTAMHYAVSHGNFDVVSILLDSKVCDVNRTNNAGYTCVMLVSLAQLKEAAHHAVVKRLFQMSDVNIRAKKHSQTALMLAVSHGNVDMVKMLLAAGAGINIQDEDGSTALMCAAEHGRIDIVKLLLAQPDCDSTVHDVDGSTALKISLEAGHRDIGVLLYSHEHITRAKSSPYTSLRRKKETNSSKPTIASRGGGSRTTGGGGGGSSSMPSSPMSSRKFLPGDHHNPAARK